MTTASSGRLVYGNSAAVLAGILSTTAYKPGWNLQVRTMHHTAHLWVRAEVPDAHPPHQPRLIDHILPVPMRDWGQDECRRWVLDSLSKIERHETREWLRFDGQQTFAPPHGDEGDPYA